MASLRPELLEILSQTNVITKNFGRGSLKKGKVNRDYTVFGLAVYRVQ